MPIQALYIRIPNNISGEKFKRELNYLCSQHCIGYSTKMEYSSAEEAEREKKRKRSEYFKIKNKWNAVNKAKANKAKINK